MFFGRIRVYDEQTRQISLLQRSGSSIRQAPQAVQSMQENLEYSSKETGKETYSSRSYSSGEYFERQGYGD
jgi:prefoldin subunit 5